MMMMMMSEESASEYALLVLFMSLFIGALVTLVQHEIQHRKNLKYTQNNVTNRHNNRKNNENNVSWKVPYTVVMFSVGLLIGFVVNYNNHYNNNYNNNNINNIINNINNINNDINNGSNNVSSAHTFGDYNNSNNSTRNPLLLSISQWCNINPNLLLYVFVPYSVFNCMANVDWFAYFQQFLPGIWLAGPGTWYCSYVLGWFIYEIGLRSIEVNVSSSSTVSSFSLSSYHLSFLVASILSATDPVAVIVILQSSKGSLQRVTNVIISESILNDAAALVLFHIFKPGIMIASSSTSSLSSLKYLIAVMIGSPALGCSLALITISISNLLSRSMMPSSSFSSTISSTSSSFMIIVTIRSILPLCCAYISFFVAEKYCNISGIFACCCAGWTYSRYSPNELNCNSVLKSIWFVIDWVGNTLLFLTSGLLVATSMMRTPVRGIDILNLFILYIVSFMIRFSMVTLSYPLISSVGKGCPMNEALYIAATGLRGVIAIALVLNIARDQALGLTVLTAEVTDRMLFYVNGFVMLTLLVNATIAEMLIDWLSVGTKDVHAMTNSEDGVSVTSNVVASIDQFEPSIAQLIRKQLILKSKDHARRLSPKMIESTFQGQLKLFVFDTTSPTITLMDTSLYDEEGVPSRDVPFNRDNDEAGVSIVNHAFETRDIDMISNPLHGTLPNGSVMRGNAMTIRDARDDFLRLVKASYLKYALDGHLARHSAALQMLLSSAESCLETDHENGLGDWLHLSMLLETSLRNAQWCLRTVTSQTASQRYLIPREDTYKSRMTSLLMETFAVTVESLCQAVVLFQHAHKEAAQMLTDMWSVESEARDVLQQVKQESKTNVITSEEFIQLHAPAELIELIHAKFHIVQSQVEQQQYLEECISIGRISEIDASGLLLDLRCDVQAVHRIYNRCVLSK